MFGPTGGNINRGHGGSHGGSHGRRHSGRYSGGYRGGYGKPSAGAGCGLVVGCFMAVLTTGTAALARKGWRQ